MVCWKKQRKGIILVSSHPNHHCFFWKKNVLFRGFTRNGQFLHDKKAGIDKTPMYSIAGTCNRSPWCFDVLVGEEQCNFLRGVLTGESKKSRSKICQDVNNYPPKLTCPPKRDHFKRTCHFPTIDFMGICLFPGEYTTRIQVCAIGPRISTIFQPYDLEKS